MNALGKTAAAMVVALLILIAGLVGVWWGGHPGYLPGFIRDGFVEDDRGLRSEVVESIKDNFYRPVQDSEIRDSSLKGIVAGLDDQFSHYLTPKEARAFTQSVQGEFEGVGMNVEEDRRGLRVIRVFEGSPADRAGIEQGEFVVAVDGRSIAGVSSDVATARIKGEAGTKVKLEIVEPRTERARTLDLKREKIEVPVAEGELRARGGGSYGVVTLTTFSNGAHGRLRRELDELLSRGAQGIVLDLRGNGGGLLIEAVRVSSQFVEDGVVVSTRGRSRPREEYDAEGDAIDSRVPVVVLVDGGSASASEIVTGALRDRRRATVVGTRTFGKGVFQEVDNLSNGGVLDITVGQYFLPSGENISNRGIVPSVRARDDQETDRDEALPVALRTLARKATLP